MALIALGNLAVLFSAEVPVTRSQPAPVVLNGKAVRVLLMSPVLPEYPPVARLNYIQGKVRLQIRVSPQGKVTTTHILKGSPILAASALKAVRKWLYRPYRTAAGPAEFQADLQFAFVLQSRKAMQIPPHAEEDFTRQVRAPEMIGRPDSCPISSAVHMRVLVNEEGRAVDADLITGGSEAFSEARDLMDGWKFRPAHWGSLAVPWYLEIDVPGGVSLLTSTGPEAIAQ